MAVTRDEVRPGRGDRARGTAGYSGTPLAKKLGIQERFRIVAVGAPRGYRRLLGPLPPAVRFAAQPKLVVRKALRSGVLALLLAALAPAASPAAPQGPYASVYLDDHRNVHAKTATGKDVLLTKAGRFMDPKLSPDGRTVGVRLVSRVKPQPDISDEDVEVTREVWIYRGGRVMRRIVPGGFIRAWDFWDGGKALAVYTGALHFAGSYILYDLSTGKALQWSKDPANEQSPDWVRALSE